jgi:hypothetical protein
MARTRDGSYVLFDAVLSAAAIWGRVLP